MSDNIYTPSMEGHDLSRSLWSSVNPGYVFHAKGSITSTTKADFKWDDKKVEEIRLRTGFNKTHNRRRDEQTRYMDAAVRFRDSLKAVPVAASTG